MAGVTIPQYTGQRELPSAPNQLPSVRQTAAPTADQLGGNARAPTDFIGTGMRSAGDDLMKVGLLMQDREDADVIFRAETVLQNKLREKTTEWEQRRGVNAWNVTKDTEAWWDKEGAALREPLNDRQRITFDRTAQRLRSHTVDKFSRFEADQRRTSLDESASANVVASIHFAAANAHNKDAVNAARADVVRAVKTRAAINGWAPERTEVEVESKLTTLHKQAIETLMEQDPAAAEAYFDLYREEIAGADRDDVKKAIDGGTRLAKAQAFADEFDPSSGANEMEALAEARKRFSGEDEKITVNEVRSRFNEQRQARENGQKDAFDAAVAEMGPTGTVARIKPSTWAKLGGEQQRRLVEQDAARIERTERLAHTRDLRAQTREQRAVTVSDSAGFARYSELVGAIADDPSSVTPEQIRDDVRSGKLSTRQGTELLKGQVSTGRKADEVHLPTLNSVVRPIVSQLGYTGKKSDRAGVLTQIASDAILAEQAIKGRPLSQQEMRAIVDELVVEGTVERDYWFDDKKRRFQVVGTDDEPKWRPGATKGSPLVEPKKRDAAPAPITKTINGKTYMKRNGQWFEQ